MDDKLQVQHHSSGAGDIPNSRVTINPFCLQTVIASDVDVEGQKLKCVTIIYTDGGTLTLNVSSFDALAIEDAVGVVPEF